MRKNVVSCVLLQDLVNSYYCQCVMGWEGQNCSVETNECINRPCLNGATCNVSYKSLQLWACSCMHRLQPCNRGKCNTVNSHKPACDLFLQDMLNDYNCTCASGFVGLHCETEVDDCLPGPCENNATCIDQVDGYTCVCAPEFTVTTLLE